MLVFDYLRRAGRRMTANTVVLRAPRPIVSFTFDDFPRSAVLNGARILEHYAARGTFYCAGSYCGQVIDGVVQYTADDLRRLFRAGHEIGCHTFNHRRVSTLNRNKLMEEIKLNKTFFACHLPELVAHTFAYPFGDRSLWATLKLQRIFEACRSTEPGLNLGTVELGRLRAIQLYDCAIDLDKISQLIRDAAASNAWLIFYTHDVDLASTRFGCTPALLEEAVKMAASSGAKLLPIRDAIREIHVGR
jgi:peptidoglycan/xylan/chitin deacetylase (PgdA/CDA1 family)